MLKRRTTVAAAVLGGSVCVSMGTLTGAAHAATGATLYVSPPGGAGVCANAPYTTISAAVAAASSGDQIDVCAGTYSEAVVVNGKSLTIAAVTGASPIIDAKGVQGPPQGITVEGSGSSGTVIRGLTVEHATREGILVQGTSGVQLLNNMVTDNDLMCQPQTGEDDCGEGIDLEAVTNSTVANNAVKYNSGGILISDGIPAGSIGAHAFGATTPYSGPSSGNQILNNTVSDNIWDCGITMAGHNSNAVANGAPAPTAGGVYGNTVKGNTVTDNGTSGGGGAGILMAAPFPGAAAYGNVVQGNTISGNGQGGIVVHSHAPGQDVNGSQFLGNTIGTNGVGETTPGQGVFTTGTTQGDAVAGDPATTGIVVYSAAVPITGTVISGNQITANYYGVWLGNADSKGVGSNTFSNVKVPVFTLPAPGSGYVLGAADGGVFTYGAIPFEGSAAGLTSGSPVVGLAHTPDSGGYWMASASGGVFSFGDAAFYGSLGNVKLNQPVVGIASTPDGHGYWLVASDGGVFSFGDAAFYGSLGNVKLNQPVVGIASTPDGHGYWLVASDGGVFSFGDAGFYGSAGSLHVTGRVVGMAGSPSGKGYWLVASDGGVYAFGDAKFLGATAAKLNKPVVGMAAQADGSGYWLFAADGGVFTFGSAGFHGSAGNLHLVQPVVGGVAAD